MEEIIELEKSKSHKEFENLLKEDLKKRVLVENSIIEAKITEITPKWIQLDAGGKSDGLVSAGEFDNLSSFKGHSYGLLHCSPIVTAGHLAEAIALNMLSILCCIPLVDPSTSVVISVIVNKPAGSISDCLIYPLLMCIRKHFLVFSPYFSQQYLWKETS